jgi:hypothetical protein
MNGIAGSIANAVNKGVPGIPLGALDAISDENTRQVLRAIVDGWHVRNGSSGTGDSAFVTRSEVDGLAALKARQAVANFGGMRLDPGEISRALNDLHTQVFESRLFRDLEARVDLIDKPGGIFDRLGATELVLTNEITQRINGDTALSTSISNMGTRVGFAEAAINQEITQRVNGDNALQSVISTQYASVNNSLALQQQSIITNANNVAAITTQLNQIQATVGANSAAIAQEAEVRANADGNLYAQYTLRLDVNGYVSGFGMANNGTVSDFIVRSDRFSIVSPDGRDVSALIMTNNTINVFDENGMLRVRIGKLS